MPLPDPGEDDDHLISHLVLGQVAEEIERQYSREQAVLFLEESRIDLDCIPAPTEPQPGVQVQPWDPERLDDHLLSLLPKYDNALPPS